MMGCSNTTRVSETVRYTPVDTGKSRPNGQGWQPAIIHAASLRSHGSGRLRHISYALCEAGWLSAPASLSQNTAGGSR